MKGCADEKKCVLVKTTLLDFPGRVAAACFVRGCDLRCPYCYNAPLVEEDFEEIFSGRGESSPQFVSASEVVAHLEKRRKVLTGFVLSGGEPLCDFALAENLILNARALGYKIKLDTNGTFPERLEELLADERLAPDYVALDVKTSPERYGELRTEAKDLGEKISRSIKIVSALPCERREFRTVLYPPLFGKREVERIAHLLPNDASWFFARFQNESCLSPEAEKIAPYSDGQAEELVSLAKSRIPNAALR